MLGISGVGMKKFDTYGEAFMREVLSHGGNPTAGLDEADELPDTLDADDPGAARTPRKREANTTAGSTMDTTFQLHRMGLSVEAIAERRELAVSTVQTHLTTAYAILRHNGVPVGKMDYLGGIG